MEIGVKIRKRIKGRRRKTGLPRALNVSSSDHSEFGKFSSPLTSSVSFLLLSPYLLLLCSPLFSRPARFPEAYPDQEPPSLKPPNLVNCYSIKDEPSPFPLRLNSGGASRKRILDDSGERLNCGGTSFQAPCLFASLFVPFETKVFSRISSFPFDPNANAVLDVLGWFTCTSLYRTFYLIHLLRLERKKLEIGGWRVSQAFLRSSQPLLFIAAGKIRENSFTSHTRSRIQRS